MGEREAILLKPSHQMKCPLFQALEGRYGADLIAAEMRLQREREEDLKRSRSQLGLPDLQVSSTH